MRITPGLLALSAAVSTASAAFQGFNYGNVFTTGQIKVQSDFESEFNTAKGLKGTGGAFNSARLYTMVQGHTGDNVIEAIPAAIKTKTSLLLGLWASAGSETFDNEVTALKKAIAEYGDDLAQLVAGISVGSEDLYRASPIGVEAGEFAGLDPDTLVGYIAKVRDAIRGTALESAKIGHVDTWTAFVDGSNAAVIEACDWLGMDAYPYFEDTRPSNGISNGAELFGDALRKTQGAAGSGKEVWITETGWPVSGKTVGDAVPSPENAQKFWRDVGCPMFGVTNVWWYTLQDAAPDTPNPSFGVIGSKGPEPLYDLSCKGFPTDDEDDDDNNKDDGDDKDDDNKGDGDDKDDGDDNNDDGNVDGGNKGDNDDKDNGKGDGDDKDDDGNDDGGKDDQDNGKDDDDNDKGGDNSHGDNDNDGSNSGENNQDEDSGTSNPPGGLGGGSDSRPEGGDDGDDGDSSNPGSGTGSGSGSGPSSGGGADEGTQEEEGTVETSSSGQLNSVGASVLAVLGAIALL